MVEELDTLESVGTVCVDSGWMRAVEKAWSEGTAPSITGYVTAAVLQAAVRE